MEWKILFVCAVTTFTTGKSQEYQTFANQFICVSVLFILKVCKKNCLMNFQLHFVKSELVQERPRIFHSTYTF